MCAELGMIASAAKQGPILIHTITGELLRRLVPDPEWPHHNATQVSEETYFTDFY